MALVDMSRVLAVTAIKFYGIVKNNMAQSASTFVSTGLRPALKNPPALARDGVRKTKSIRPAKKTTKRTKISKTKGIRSSRTAISMMDDVRMMPSGAFAIHRDQRAMNVSIAFFSFFALLLLLLAVTLRSLELISKGF